MRNRTAAVGLLAAPLLIASGVTAGALARPVESPKDLSGPAPVTSAPAVADEFTDARQVSIRFAVRPNAPLTTARAGRLTASSCRVGTAVAAGRELVRIDDRPVVALSTSVPLYRDLAADAKGSDVRALKVALAALGHQVTSSAAYDASTVKAVRALQKATGISPADGTLRLVDVVWVPAGAVPATCEVALGARVEAGASLATLPGSLEKVSYVAPAGLVPGPRTLSLWGSAVTIGDDATTDATFLAAVSATREFAAHLKSGDTQEVNADLALATPLRVVKVSPAALFGLQGSAGCVQVGERVVPVTVVGSGLGVSVVTSADAFTEVRVGDGLTQTACPRTT